VPTPSADPAVVRQAMHQGLADGVFPGAVLQIVVAGREVFHEAYGKADLQSGEAVTGETLFDLASLTKPLCTSLAVMRLVQRGIIALETRLEDVLEEFSATAKAPITLRQLLSHRSGLPAWRPYFETLRDLPPEQRAEALRQLLVSEPLLHAPDETAVYSDLDFMLLQMAVERLVAVGLDVWVEREIYAPLGIDGLCFTDVFQPPPPRAFAATENCPWRGRVLKGHVHDDNAYAMGGVAGHAGLFGTARAVGKLLAAMMCAEKGRPGAKLFDANLLRTFWTRPTGGDWALGFDTPAAEGSSSGHFFDRRSVGHLGFTGTSFWLDRSRQISVVLLTNRVHPTRRNEKIKLFRPVIHDHIMRWLGCGG
jgi:CubicO group peptidase (beta-lactamase class C family)